MQRTVCATRRVIRHASSAPLIVCLLTASTLNARAQRQPGPQLRPFVRTAASLIALTHTRVIDGTGAPARLNQTLILRDGLIEWAGDDARASIPAAAEIIDLTGHTVMPGYVMLHEHMFYPAGQGMYNTLGFSFPRLYLAGGATTIRTGGSMMPYADLNIKHAIDAGQMPGPKMHITAPYLNGPGLPIPGVKALRGPDDARRMVEYWADEGATSFKAYMHISRAELRAAVDAAHARGLRITGHLCSVTYREAAEIGIDNLEHGFFAATDFVAGKPEDQCVQGRAALLGITPDSPAFRDLVRVLIDHDVAITSTLTVFEISTPGRPRAFDAALDAMNAEAREQYLRQFSRVATDTSSSSRALFRRAMALERAFAEAGGLLVAGTDPTGYGGVVAGFANQRQIELLAEAGFSAEQAVRIGTLNGAIYLGIDMETGSIAPAKAADLIVVRGDPTARITDVRNVEIVFKDGIGYDPARLIESVRGSVGYR
ncbi:MAG: amidohydrolase family protein [Gemmatimonadetes bacterium]|nr:amidohydrolase family protein [Gemmatimonadota bacterium]